MAKTTGTYTDLNNALTKVRDWASTNGWTILSFIDDATKNFGDTFTGKRLHISKSLGGTTRYFNFRSCSNQNVVTGGYDNVTGICLNGSTGYDGGLGWQSQPGGTKIDYSSTTAQAGCIDKMKASGGAYWFYAQGNSLTCVFETSVALGDKRMFTIGIVDDYTFYAASGGNDGTIPTPQPDYDTRSGYLARTRALTKTGAWAMWDGTGWLADNLFAKGARLIPALVIALTGPYHGFGIASALVLYSPDPVKGNTILAPSMIMAGKDISPELYPVGEIDGIKFANMKHYSDGQALTYGGDTYDLFRIRNILTNFTGVAIKQ